MRREAILTVNTGSSSIKLSAYERSGMTLGNCLLKVNLSGLPNDMRFVAKTPEERLDRMPEALSSRVSHQKELVGALAKWAADALQDVDLRAIGHRVVHGGRDFDGPVLANKKILEHLRGLSSLAPSHQPANLDGVKGISRIWPEIPQTLSFDTAFHRTQPRVAQLYAIPRHLSEEGLLRFGFHGLSYDHIASQLEGLTEAGKRSRVIAAHLGSGASVCAMLNGKSIATSMGLTALDGVPMSTRAGSVDPGLLLHLMMDKGMSARDLSTMLYKESGLLGLSGISGDVRELLENSETAAMEALAVYTYRIAREIGSLATALHGVDTLVFTGGVGENSAPVRQDICAHLEWMGLQIDSSANDAGHREIQTPASKVQVLVIPANEEVVIARDALSVLEAR
ncbi:acetate/propionate family kinase [Henriciella mobilis]|uniref:acetate/propionate family kinase n=1 Tax=Henriciella mobilis TaxID=2305467 RepID=UPI00131407FB|nr:acetate/propionate family kinase [Henriciella mobilis]